MAHVETHHVLTVAQIIGVIVKQSSHAEVVGHEIVLVRPQGNAGAQPHRPDHLIFVPHPIPVGCHILICNVAGHDLGLAVSPIRVVEALAELAAQAENDLLHIRQVFHLRFHLGKIGHHGLGQIHLGVGALEHIVPDAYLPADIHIGILFG